MRGQMGERGKRKVTLPISCCHPIVLFVPSISLSHSYAYIDQEETTGYESELKTNAWD